MTSKSPPTKKRRRLRDVVSALADRRANAKKTPPKEKPVPDTPGGTEHSEVDADVDDDGDVDGQATHRVFVR